MEFPFENGSFNMVFGFPCLEFVLSKTLLGVQYTPSTDTLVQLTECGFGIVPLIILGVSTSKELVLFQVRAIEKRIWPFGVGISFEAWPLHLAAFKWLKIAATAFLTLAWGLPLQHSAPLLSARVNITSIPGFWVSFPKPLNSSCNTTVQSGKLQCTDSPEMCHKPCHVLLSITSLFAKSRLFTDCTHHTI